MLSEKDVRLAQVMETEFENIKLSKISNWKIAKILGFSGLIPFIIAIFLLVLM